MSVVPLPIPPEAGQEPGDLRRDAGREVFQVHVETIEAARGEPITQFGRESELPSRVGEQTVRGRRVEFLTVSVAQDRHDLKAVLARDP